MQQDIKFVGETRTLAATICTPAHRSNGDPSGGIVFVHGLGSNRRGYIEYGERVAAQLGLTCLALDLSGHGSGSGYDDSFSPRQHLQDVLAAWDELTGRYGADPERIGVCGSSYGACMAALAAQHRKVARLLLRAPAIVADGILTARCGSAVVIVTRLLPQCCSAASATSMVRCWSWNLKMMRKYHMRRSRPT